MLDKFKKWFGEFTAVKLISAVQLGREFAGLVKAGQIQAATDKAVEIVKLFVPAAVSTPLETLLDALIAAVTAGIALYKAIIAFIGNTGGGVQIVAMEADDATMANAMDEACDMLSVKAVACADPAIPHKPEFGIIEIGAIIQIVWIAIQWIRKRREDRKLNPHI